MKKIKEQKTKVYWLCGDPKVSVVLQAECTARNEPNLAGSARKGFSDPHPMEMMRLLCEETENFGLQFVKTNFIKTELFSFQIVNLSINVTHVVV